MTLSKADVAMLGRRAQQPVKAVDELLAIFVPGPLRNPSNGSYVHWSKHRKWARDWKERVALALLEASRTGGVWSMRRDFGGAKVDYFPPSDAPKRVSFLANVHTLFDDDNLASSLKPVRDGLVDCGVIHGDGPRDGHSFSYAQQVNRQHRGVEIRIRLL